jgi:hypothetical protein
LEIGWNLQVSDRPLLKRLREVDGVGVRPPTATDLFKYPEGIMVIMLIFRASSLAWA